MAPPDATPGRRWEAPEATARKFFPLLSTGDTTFRDPKKVTSVRLAGRVARVEGGVARLAKEGEIAAVHAGTKDEGKEGKGCSRAAKVLGGAGAYDVQAGCLRALTLVYDGRFRNYPPYDNPPARFGAVVEWARESRQP